MKYEAVHAIRSWSELKQRLVGPSRYARSRPTPSPFRPNPNPP